MLHFDFNSCGRRLLSGRGDAGEHGLGIAHRALGRFAADTSANVAIIFALALVMEIRHYRQSKTLAGIARVS